MIEDGYLGEVLSVEVQALQTGFADFDSPLHWRQDRELSGYNTLNIGANYESMMRWLGRGNRVMAINLARRRRWKPRRRDLPWTWTPPFRGG